MRTLKNYQKTVCGLGFGKTWRVLKFKTYYSYQIRDLFNKDELFKIYKGNKKAFGLNKITMPLIMVLFNFLYGLFILLTYFPKRYFNGGYWFVKNTSWAQDVEFFNWSNVFIIIGLILFVFLR